MSDDIHCWINSCLAQQMAVVGVARPFAQVNEYEEVMARVQPVFKPLLKPHLEDMEKKVAPGMFILTWASMNIDGYLHRFKQVRLVHQQ